MYAFLIMYYCLFTELLALASTLGAEASLLILSLNSVGKFAGDKQSKFSSSISKLYRVWPDILKLD